MPARAKRPPAASVELFRPRGEMTPEMLSDVLAVAGAPVPAVMTETWTPMERLLAYDWAIRAHLKASDNKVTTYEKPGFVRAAEAPNLAPGEVMAEEIQAKYAPPQPWRNLEDAVTGTTTKGKYTAGSSEHVLQLSATEAALLREWIKHPNGSWGYGRVTVEAVEGGGLLIRTRPYRPENTS